MAGQAWPLLLALGMIYQGLLLIGKFLVTVKLDVE
jgi:hypothetical protein